MWKICDCVRRGSMRNGNEWRGNEQSSDGWQIQAVRRCTNCWILMGKRVVNTHEGRAPHYNN